MSYNVHSLIHVVEDVKHHGALETYSAFPFENYLGQIKSYLRGGKIPLQQIARRTTEKSATEKESTGKPYPFLSKKHL